MKIQFLGTAAAEGVPALWCDCPTCRHAKVNQGKNLRRRSAYLINEDTLIDFGPDIFWQSMNSGLDLTMIKRILFTHSHEDHLNSADFIWRKPGFSSVSRKLAIYCNRNVVCKLERICECSLEKMQMELEILQPGKVVDFSEFSVLPVEAQHTPDEQAFNFILQESGKSILIANDTGWWNEKSWKITEGLNLDAAILECTLGLNDKYRAGRSGHLGVDSMIDFRDRLVLTGALKPTAKVWATHFSHNGKCIQSDLEKALIPHNIRPAYDGLTVELKKSSGPVVDYA